MVLGHHMIVDLRLKIFELIGVAFAFCHFFSSPELWSAAEVK